MAKANWVRVSPSQGSGNATVNVSSVSEHTGRNARTTTLTWKAANVADVVRTVSQAGKPQYVDIENTAAADKNGKVVTISGYTNAPKLTFTLGSGDLNIALPTSYKANSVTTNNGATISGDPGATAEFVFSIEINVPANATTEPMTRQIVVSDGSGHSDTCTLTLAGGDAYVTVAEGTIELDYLGTAVGVQVQSNTNWEIV